MSKCEKCFLVLAAWVFAAFCGPAAPAFAAFEDGLRAYMDENYEIAVVEWSKAAMGGDAKSMAYIGYVYFGGLGGYADDQKAIEWFGRAAELGDPDGAAALARIYAHGWGVEKDEKKAYALIASVADADNFAAQMTASEFYELGIGTDADLEKALMHANRIPLIENGLSVVAARKDRIAQLSKKLETTEKEEKTPE